MGGWIRKAASRAALDHHAANVSRRHVLLDQSIASGLADGRVVQSGGLPDQRLPLELLRNGRRERRLELGDDRPVPRRLPGDGVGDV